MDPNYNVVWSTSEVDMARSFIASHTTNNTYTNDKNKKHNEIVDVLQARFPGKEKNQVVELYVHLVVEMNTKQSNALVNDSFGMPTEDTNMDNISRLNVVPKKKRQNPVIAWSRDEHKNFLRGLEVHGRGSWKNISRFFVPTRTPMQICSHAQKYFQRKECTTKKRLSINDVGLYDTEPWAQKNSSSLEALAFGDGAYNTNYYDFQGQHTVLNKLTHTSEVSKTRGQHIIGNSSIDPTMVQSNSLGWETLAFPSSANTNYFEFDEQHDAMNNLACADQASNNHVATWTKGQQTTTSPSVAPVAMQNTSPSWEELSFIGNTYNTNSYDFDGHVALNNIAREQPW